MGSLTEAFNDETKKPGIVSACATLVNSEVSKKKGASGFVIKTGYKAFKKLKPGIVESAVGILYNDFTEVLDNYYCKYSDENSDSSNEKNSEVKPGNGFADWLTIRDKEVAADFLKIADKIVASVEKGGIKTIYKSMRKHAEKNVIEAVPGIGLMVEKSMKA